MAQEARHGAAARRARRDEGLTRYVGGAVRDDLLGLPVNDVDLATRLAPEEVDRAAGEGADQGGPDRDRARHDHRRQRRPAVRGHHASTRRHDRRPARHRRLHRRLEGRRGAARFHHQRACRPTRRPARSSIISAASTILGSAASASSATRLQRIAEDHLRILRFFRFHARFGTGEPDSRGARRLHRAGQRSDGLVARADRRRVAEAARPARPGGTVAIMLDTESWSQSFRKSTRKRLAGLEA